MRCARPRHRIIAQLRHLPSNMEVCLVQHSSFQKRPHAGLVSPKQGNNIGPDKICFFNSAYSEGTGKEIWSLPSMLAHLFPVPSLPQILLSTRYLQLARSLTKVNHRRGTEGKMPGALSVRRSSEQLSSWLTGVTPSLSMPSQASSAQKPQPGLGRAAQV